MKEVFIHTEGNLRGKPRKVTRCIILEEQTVKAEGLAICNPKDQYSRKRGNLIARGRACKALETQNPYPLGIIDGLEVSMHE